MPTNTNRKIHLVYVRFAFPLPEEPGPKRPLEIVNRYQRMGHRITVITSSSNWMTGRIESKKKTLFSCHTENGMEFIRVAAIPKYRSSMFRRLLNYAVFTLLAFWAGTRILSKKEENAIIFVDISPPFAVLGGYFLSRLRKKARLILEITDLPETVFELGMFDNIILKTVTGRVFRHIYKVSDQIIALTPGARRHIADLGISQDKITIVTNWLSDKENVIANNVREKIRAKHGWQNHFVVMYAGGHGKAYDLMTLIKAAEILKDAPKLTIVFMGEGERKREYIQYCEDRDLTLCRFIAPVPRNMLGAYLASADVCVNLFYKGEFWNKVIGHKIIDYFEAGRPIIFAGDGDTADIIRQANGGNVVPPENPEELSRAILEMMENRDKIRQMGLRGRDYLKREYHKEKLLKRLDAVFLNDC